jgi:hypothetical protein
MESKTTTKMEKWKKEIKRLNDIRLKLGLNFNQIEVLTGINRGKIGRFFNMINEPSLGFYLDVKMCLENEIKVNTKEKKEVPAKVEKTSSTPIKEIAPKNDCDCYMSGSLFLRGKSGCKKTKEEHKF